MSARIVLDEIYEKVAQLTADERAQLLPGWKRWTIKSSLKMKAKR